MRPDYAASFVPPDTVKKNLRQNLRKRMWETSSEDNTYRRASVQISGRHVEEVVRVGEGMENGRIRPQPTRAKQAGQDVQIYPLVRPFLTPSSLSGQSNGKGGDI
jgi:hypothetical protein